MDYAIPSDPLLHIAFSGGLAALAATLLLVVVIALLRYTIGRDRRAERALAERWQPVFFHALEGEAVDLPRVRPGDWQIVLQLWIGFAESLRGTALLRLRDLAARLPLEKAARRLLRRRGIRSRLPAVVALGRMRSAAAAAGLVALADHPNAILSLLAVRSLVHIDPRRGLPMLLERLPGRPDWPLVNVAAMLEEVPAGLLAPPLLAAVRAATAENAPRFIRLLHVGQIGDTWPVLAPYLAPEQPPEVLAAALKACNDPRGLPAVRALAGHGQWIVRALAAATLGRIGVAEDRRRLETLLSDREWWVRHRAASALAAFPGMSRQQLQALAARLADRFAADALAQALAEKTG